MVHSGYMNKHVTRFVSLVSITTLFIPSFLVFAEEIPSSINTNTTTVESVSPEVTSDTTVQQVTSVDTTTAPETTESSSSSTPTAESTSTPPIAEEAPQAEATPTPQTQLLLNKTNNQKLNSK
jgi:cytoskeletal protein RodZ